MEKKTASQLLDQQVNEFRERFYCEKGITYKCTVCAKFRDLQRMCNFHKMRS